MNNFNPGYPGQPGYNPNGYQRQDYFQPMQQPGIICRLVGSKEEAAAYPIPSDGTVGLFIDRAADKVHTKAFRQDGTVCMQTYSRDEDPPIPQYVTMEQFADVLTKLEKLEKTSTRGRKTDDE